MFLSRLRDLFGRRKSLDELGHPRVEDVHHPSWHAFGVVDERELKQHDNAHRHLLLTRVLEQLRVELLLHVAVVVHLQ